MKLTDYLLDKKFLILLYSLTSLFTGAVIYMGESVKLSESNGLYVVGVSLFLLAIYLTIDFILIKNYYRSLIEAAQTQGLDWVLSLPAPVNREQRIFNKLLQKLYQDTKNRLAEHYAKSVEDLEFITMWVHEIKTPIAAAELIIENTLNNLSEKALYSIEDEIDKIEDLVQMTLFYARTGDFAKDYLINSVNLAKIIKDCIKREYSSITNKNLKLKMANVDIQIDTDEKWLGFILKQILDNAIKYSAPGGEIKISTEYREKEMVLNIEDTGAGIAEEDIRRIFDKNFTGANGRKLYTATGMGLYLSRKLARKLGHYLTVASACGQGTKVSVHFPKWSDYHDV